MIRIELTEIAAEKISVANQVQILIKSLVMIPIAYLAHVFQFIYGLIYIPNKTIDLLHTSQKIKQILKRKQIDTKSSSV